MNNSEQKWELAVAVLVSALGIGAWVFSSQFPTQANPIVGPAFFPRVLAVIIVLTSVFMVVQRLVLARKTVPEVSTEPSSEVSTQASLGSKAKLIQVGRLFGLIFVLGFAPWILPQIGLLFTAVFYTMIVSFLLGAKWHEALIGGVTMLVFVYLVFIQILKVSA